MKSILFCLLWGCFISIVDSKTESNFKFGKDCSVTLQHVNEDTVFYAEYDGKSDLDFYCNYMSFSGRDDGYLNEYEICVTPETYEDPGCAVKLHYGTSFRVYDLKTFTCTDKPKVKYCGKQDEFLYITLEKVNDDAITANTRLKLKIEAVMTYNYAQTIGIIVGSVIGGLFLISLGIGIVVCLACRRKRSPGQVMNPTGTTSFQMQHTNNSSGFAGTQPIAQTPGLYPTQPTGYTPSQTNYSTNYSAPPGNNQADLKPSGFTYSS